MGQNCALAATGAENDYANSNHIIFSITLSAKGNQKLSKLLSEGSERSVYCNENKTD